MLISRLAATRGCGRCLTIALVVAVARGVLIGAETPPAVSEYQLKAAFISKFPQFVTWPTVAFAGRDRFAICVLAPNPFGAELDELVAGDTAAGRPVVVRVVAANGTVEGCHVVFIPARATGKDAVLAQVRNQPVLTIGEVPSFVGEDGGILDLQLVDGRMRFDVDVAAATRAGLVVSSQLLRLALHVRGAQP